MKKSDLRAAIKQLESDNRLANDSRASHDALVKELAEAKKRKAVSDNVEATYVVVNFREEACGEVKFSWKLCQIDDNGNPIAKTPLQYGAEIPTDGHQATDFDGNPLVIDGNIDDLEIEAGDLPIREKFDARRLYKTPNGSKVVFKRVENGAVILWSYKMSGEIQAKMSQVLERLDEVAQQAASPKKRATQKIVAAYLIAQNPHITGAELTAMLKQAFPGANVDSRHGPHYLSLSRSGKLPEAPDTDPREW